MNTKYSNILRYSRVAAIILGMFLVFNFGSKGLRAQTTDDSNSSTTDGNSTSQRQGSSSDGLSTNEEVLQLNLQIQEKKQALDQLNQQKAEYERNLALKQEEALSLNSELGSLDEQVKKTEVEIDIANNKIETLKLQIKEVDGKIKDREADIMDRNSQLGGYIRQLNRMQNTNVVQVLLANDKFSDFFNELNSVEDLEHRLKGSLDEVKQLREDLQDVQGELVRKKTDLDDATANLVNIKEDLTGQMDYKSDLLDVTKDNEAKYQELLSAVKTEQGSVNSELSQIENDLRTKLDSDNQLTDDTKILSWPVNPANGITATFHDPSYIFRRLFEHPAIDIRAKQGTPVKAAASGYVGRAKDAGMGYSYIMIIHAGGVSTVYGHISQINVQEDAYVTRGQIIGLSGGMPGTPGAGRLTTGSHLHFEVRKDGIPVNPLNYLP
jgi:murein DD-endopeptidase MepM/ murein hydrolase activator NlpD